MKKHMVFLSAVLSAALLFSGTALVSSAATSGLQAYWNFNEGSGSIAYDSAGAASGRNLSVAKGTAQWTTGRDGKAFYFNGSTVLSMDGMKQIMSQNITVSLWAKLDTLPATGDTSGLNEFLSTEQAGAIGKGAMDFGFAFGSMRSYVVNAFAQGTGDEVTNKNINAKSYVGSWHQFAVVYDEDNEVGKLYVDGKLVQKSDLTSIPGIPIYLGYPKNRSYPVTTNLDIGGYINTDGKAVRTIKGAVDELRVYNRALSDSELQTLASVGSTAVSSHTGTVVTSQAVKVSSAAGGSVSSATASNSSSSKTSSGAASAASGISALVSSETSESETVSAASAASTASAAGTHKSGAVVWIILAVVVILAAAGGCLYYFVLRKKAH